MATAAVNTSTITQTSAVLITVLKSLSLGHLRLQSVSLTLLNHFYDRAEVGGENTFTMTWPLLQRSTPVPRSLTGTYSPLV
jgi:hypothetical protein